MTQTELVELIVDTARSVAAEQGLETNVELTRDTRLFGQGGLLDSLALVSLVVAVEQGVEEKFGARVELADDKALSQKNSPYRTVGTLADYAFGQIKTPGAG